MKPKTHVFAIAVETYQDSKIPRVIYAENDATRFVEAWHELGVDPSDCVTLLSSKATYVAVKSHLKKFLNHVAVGERVIIFYAGHGAAFSDASYVTVHDTQIGDIQATSIPLSEILRQVRESNSEQVTLFVDSCHSGLPITPGMRSIYTSFSADELKTFCEDSKFHVAFASCRVSEFSYSSVPLKHGIWSHCVIEALKANAKDALEQGCLITGRSLQGYLQTEVPRVLKVTITGTAKQTPCIFGNATKEFIVADVEQILQQRLAAAATPVNFIKDSSLAKQVRGNVKRLSGYWKPPYPLKSHSTWEQNFVESAGESEVRDQATAIHDAIRNGFGYKRKDITFTIDKGSASIKTPDFDVNVTLTQDPDDAEQYIFLTEVTTFRRPAVIQEPEFLKIFTRYCDTIVIDLGTSLDLEAKIDEIEAIQALSPGLDYEPDCTEFTLLLANLGILIRATADRLTFSLTGRGDLGDLINYTQAAFAQLGGSNITLGLPG